MAALPFCCRRRRISADQNAVTRRRFSGDVPAGVSSFENVRALPLNMFYTSATVGSNYKNIIFCDDALP